MYEFIDSISLNELKDLYSKICALENELQKSFDSLLIDLETLKKDMIYARKVGMNDVADEIEKHLGIAEQLHSRFKTTLYLLSEQRIKLKAYILKFDDNEWYQAYSISAQSYLDRYKNLEVTINGTFNKINRNEK